MSSFGYVPPVFSPQWPLLSPLFPPVNHPLPSCEDEAGSSSTPPPPPYAERAPFFFLLNPLFTFFLPLVFNSVTSPWIFRSVCPLSLLPFYSGFFVVVFKTSNAGVFVLTIGISSSVFCPLGSFQRFFEIKTGHYGSALLSVEGIPPFPSCGLSPPSR